MHNNYEVILKLYKPSNISFAYVQYLITFWGFYSTESDCFGKLLNSFRF